MENFSSLNPLLQACYTVPHIVEQILYFCSPAAFDSVRLTCKTLYRASLSRRVLRDKLTTLLRHPYSLQKYDFTTDEQLYRAVARNEVTTKSLLRLFSLEIAKRQSTWRIPCRTLVIDIGQSQKVINNPSADPEVFDVNVTMGTSRGEYLAVVWTDPWNGADTQLGVYHMFRSAEIPFLRLQNPRKYGDEVEHEYSTPRHLLSQQTVDRKCPGKHKNLDANHCQIPEQPWFRYGEDFTVSLVEGVYKILPEWMIQRSPRPKDKEHCSVTLHVSCLPRKQAHSDWNPMLVTSFNPSMKPETYLKAENLEDDEYALKMEEIQDAYTLNFYDGKSSFRGSRAFTDMYLDMAADEDINFRLSPQGECYATGYGDAHTSASIRSWNITLPVYRAGQSYQMNCFKNIEVKFARCGNTMQDRSSHDTIPCLSLTGILKRHIALGRMQSFMVAGDIPKCNFDTNDLDHGYTLPLELPTTEGPTSPSLLLVSPAPAFFFKKVLLKDDITSITPSERRYMYKMPTCYRIDQEDVPSDLVLRVIGLDDQNQLWLWEIQELDILLAAVTRSHKVLAKPLQIVKNVKGIATVNHVFGQKAFVLTYGPQDQAHEPNVRRCKDFVDGNVIYHQPKTVVPHTAASNLKDKDQWRLIVFDFEQHAHQSAHVAMDKNGNAETIWTN